MGTAISVEAHSSTLDKPVLHERLDVAFAWFREVDARFSTYQPDSEVSRLSSGRLRVADASTDTRMILRLCEEMRDVTGGYFDAYATGRLDPSGIVKGWSAQVASDRLLAAGVRDHLVNAGGDVRIRGFGPDGAPWRIGIAHPWERQKVAWVVEAPAGAVATSGVYERGRHIIDPFTGASVAALASVTVIGADLGVADAYSTAAMAMGARAIDWLARLDGYESAVITRDRLAFCSSGFTSIPDAAAEGPEDHARKVG